MKFGGSIKGCFEKKNKKFKSGTFSLMIRKLYTSVLIHCKY